ncbi:MAG TPA: hypothetical protein VII06_03040 [Chloroflexota bacterium]|jgi:hypothetical protein
MQGTWRRERAGTELAALLAPLRRRLWWQGGTRLVLRALCLVLGAVLADATLAVLGLVPMPDARVALAGAALVLVALLVALLRPPSLLATARSIDRAAGLAERVGTAVELAEAHTRGPTAVVQIADAADRVRALPAAAVVPLTSTRHYAVLAVGLALLTAGMLLLAGLGEGMPGGLVPLRQLIEAATGKLGPGHEENHAAATTHSEVDARLAPLMQQLDALRSNEAGLTPDEAAAQRAAAAQQLADLAAASRTQQQALSELARALQGTSAGREVADNLMQGDYQRAADALAALGRESDQLSPAGRRQLADALRQAQAGVRPLSPSLADAAQRASQALNGRDYRRTEQALSDLANGVADAGRSVVAQGDLGMLGEALAEQGTDLDEALAALAGMGTDGAGQSGGQQGNGPPGSGPPGTQPGAANSTDAARLGASGSPVPLDNLPSLDGPPSAQPPDPDRPSVLSPVSIGATGGGAPTAASGPLTATGETAAVPTERREVVRDYFGNEGSR